MAYTDNQKSTGLDLLTDLTITQSDLHIVGDVSDSGRAKAITQNLLEDYIANSTNFVDELVANNYFITELNNSGIGSTIDVQENGVSVENPVDTINFVTNGGIVSTPLAGVVDVDLTALLAGGGGTKIEIDTTQKAATNNSQTYTISVPGGILSTNNAIRFELPISSFQFTGTGNAITIAATYGGTSVGSVSLTNPSSSSVTGGAIYKGIIMATGATNTQKGVVVLTGSVENNIGGAFELQQIDSATANAAVDSTVAQNLVVTITSAGTAATIITEGIIVEKITTGSGGGISSGNEIYFGNYTKTVAVATSYDLPTGSLWKFNDYLILQTNETGGFGFVGINTTTIKIDPVTGNPEKVTTPWTLSSTPLYKGNIFVDENQSKLYVSYIKSGATVDFVIDEFDSAFINTATYTFTGNIQNMTIGKNLLKIGSNFYAEVQQNLSGTIATLATYRFDISGTTLINPTITNLPSLQQASWDGTNVWGYGSKYTVSGTVFTLVPATYTTPGVTSANISALSVYGVQIFDGKYNLWQPTGSYSIDYQYTGSSNSINSLEIVKATLRQYPLPI